MGILRDFPIHTDRALSITQEKPSFVPSVVHIPTMIGNTWLNGLCNDVYILSTGVAAFHYFFIISLRGEITVLLLTVLH